MGEALRKHDEETNKTIAREEILEYLAFSTFKEGTFSHTFYCPFSNFILCVTGHLKEALQLTNELLEIVPFHQRALGNKKYYEDLLREQNIQRRGETGRYSSSQ